MGRPLYERLGFVAEGAATAWRGTAGSVAGAVTIRRLCEDDRDAVAELDRIATGEDRSNLLDALHPLSGVAVDRAGALAGWAAKAPYGAGIAICAADEEAGAALMAAAAGGAAPATLVVPDANAAANANLRRWGFRRQRRRAHALRPAGRLAPRAPVRSVQPVLGLGDGQGIRAPASAAPGRRGTGRGARAVPCAVTRG
jgi:formylglycine-generating enzyme required for sulfatase activity